MNRLLMASTLLLSLAVARPALADRYSDSEPMGRRGGFIGLGLGGGEIRCQGDGCGDDDFPEAGGIDLHAGLLLGERIGISIDAWVMVHREEETVLGIDNTLTISHGLITAGPQIWLIPRLWLKGGLGLAQARYDFNSEADILDSMDESDTVPAAMVAAGIELVADDDFALDLQLRAGVGLYDEGDTELQNVAVQVGFTFF